MGVEFVRRPDDPAVSVVIPSVPAYDHGDTLQCLADQSINEPYEVLVVNDGSLDRSEARNVGLQAANADIVALTDDDTKPPVDWLENVYSEFVSDQELVCLEGAVYGGCRNLGPRNYVGCNLAVRRDIALSVGGFRSEFSEWREDIEFGWRMERDADGVCRYAENVRMCHPTAPRTAYKPELEQQLRQEYPRRYEDVLNGSVARRAYRRLRSLGLTQPVHRGLNVLRRVVGDPHVSRSRSGRTARGEAHSRPEEHADD